MRWRSLSVSSAIAAPLGVGNFQTVMVAMNYSSCLLGGVVGRARPGRGSPGSGVEDLALLQLELRVVQDAGVPELGELAQLRQLGVRVDPGRRLRRRLGVLRLGLLRLRLLVGPPIGLPP